MVRLRVNVPVGPRGLPLRVRHRGGVRCYDFTEEHLCAVLGVARADSERYDSCGGRLRCCRREHERSAWPATCDHARQRRVHRGSRVHGRRAGQIRSARWQDRRRSRHR